jgi:hypothetical protein
LVGSHGLPVQKFDNFRTGIGDWPKFEPGTKDLQLELDMPKTCFYPSFSSKNLKLKEKFK